MFIACLLLRPPEVKDCGVRENVELHEVGRAHGLHQDDGRGRGSRAQVQREIRLPAGVHHERVHGAAQALRHHEGRRESGLQGLRGGHAQRIAAKVGGVL